VPPPPLRTASLPDLFCYKYVLSPMYNLLVLPDALTFVFLKRNTAGADVVFDSFFSLAGFPSFEPPPFLFYFHL